MNDRTHMTRTTQFGVTFYTPSPSLRMVPLPSVPFPLCFLRKAPAQRAQSSAERGAAEVRLMCRDRKWNVNKCRCHLKSGCACLAGGSPAAGRGGAGVPARDLRAGRRGGPIPPADGAADLVRARRGDHDGPSGQRQLIQDRHRNQKRQGSGPAFFMPDAMKSGPLVLGPVMCMTTSLN